MAGDLGAVQLTLGIDDTPFQAGVRRAKALAEKTGEEIIKGLAGNTGTIGGLNQKLAQLRSDLDATQIGTKRFRELRTEIDKTAKALDGVQGGRVVGAIGNIATALAGLGAGTAIVKIFKDSLDAAIQLETVSVRLANTLGPEGAASALNFTRRTADQLGLSAKTLATTYSRFTAAASAASIPLSTQEELFTAVAKAGQQLGLSNDEISGTFLALQQIASKGTVSMEELRQQLGERLPTAIAASAKGLGLTQRELIKLVESGGLSAERFFPALTKGLNDLSAATTNFTAQQKIEQLGNAFQYLKEQIGGSALPAVVQQVEGLTKALQGLDVILEAKQLGLGGGLVGYLGFIPDQGAEAVGALRALQQQFNLTEGQARALFTDAVKGEGGRLDAFGQLTLDAEEFANVLAKLPGLAQRFREKYPDLSKINSQQKADDAAALAGDKARAEVQKTITGPSKERLQILQTTLSLQGEEQAIALKRLEIAKAIKAQEEATAALRKAQKDSGSSISSVGGVNNNDPAVIKAAGELEKAGDALNGAYLELGKLERNTAANTTLFAAQFKLQAQALQDRITKAKELAGIEDQAQRAQVAAAQSVLDSIAQARQKQAELGLQLQNQVAKGGSTEDIRNTIAQLSAAGGELELALVNGGRALKDQLNEATKRLDDTLTSNFAILTQIGKQRVLEQAQANITRGVQTGLIDPTLIPSQSNAQAFIAFGQQAAAIADSVASFNATQRSVADAQTQLATDFASTGTLVTKSIGNLADTAIPNLISALNSNASAGRSITVTVNADTGQTFINQAAALP